MRSVFVQRKVLELYRIFPYISYPLQPDKLLRYVPLPCKSMTYQHLAEITGCSVYDVASICKSESGATHFDPDSSRYLILYNGEMNIGRIRWTIAHEIGHIHMGHFQSIEITENRIAYHDGRASYGACESEADYFAWNLLAPLPIMREMQITSAEQTMNTYGLSSQAAEIQWERYQRWCSHHIKTAWDSEMIRAFRSKAVL